MKIRGQQVYSLRERIERNSTPVTESGCWVWMGAVKGKSKLNQYGNMIIGSRIDGSRRNVAAHRASYMAYKGEIPEGMFVCHCCDTPCCVNPNHLFLGTRQDNVDDREKKGRNKLHIARKARWPEPPKGI